MVAESRSGPLTAGTFVRMVHNRYCRPNPLGPVVVEFGAFSPSLSDTVDPSIPLIGTPQLDVSRLERVAAAVA